MTAWTRAPSALHRQVRLRASGQAAIVNLPRVEARAKEAGVAITLEPFNPERFVADNHPGHSVGESDAWWQWRRTASLAQRRKAVAGPIPGKTAPASRIKTTAAAAVPAQRARRSS